MPDGSGGEKHYDSGAGDEECTGSGSGRWEGATLEVVECGQHGSGMICIGNEQCHGYGMGQGPSVTGNGNIVEKGYGRGISEANRGYCDEFGRTPKPTGYSTASWTTSGWRIA